MSETVALIWRTQPRIVLGAALHYLVLVAAAAIAPLRRLLRDAVEFPATLSFLIFERFFARFRPR